MCNPEWADFPGLGMDGGRYYITSNQFTFFFPVQFKQTRLLVIPKLAPTQNTTNGCGAVASAAFNNLRNPDNSKSFTVVDRCIVFLVSLTAPGSRYVPLGQIQE